MNTKCRFAQRANLHFIFHYALEVSPFHDHKDLLAHTGVSPDHKGPMAMGHIMVENGRATWEVNSNMNIKVQFTGATLDPTSVEVENGYFTPRLRKLKAGDLLEIHGPFGKFGIDKMTAEAGKFVFIASGTGIAPFRSMIRTYPEINYTLIHGVRESAEAYDREEYAADRYVLCTSRDLKGDYVGRLTGYLKICSFAPETQFYICGNSNMIFDALDILKNKGFERDQIHCEVYF